MHWIWIITFRSPLFPPRLHTRRTHAPPANNISISPCSVLRPLNVQMMIGSAWTGQPVLLSLALHRSNVHLNRQIATVTHLKHKVGVRGHLVSCLENGYHLLPHKDEQVPKRKTDSWIMTWVGMIAMNPLNERWEWFLKIWNQFKHFNTAQSQHGLPLGSFTVWKIWKVSFREKLARWLSHVGARVCFILLPNEPSWPYVIEIFHYCRTQMAIS